MATKCSRFVPVDDLYSEDNVRSEECQQTESMVESLKRHGFQPNHPLVLSEKVDGRMLVLCGNRRMAGVKWLQENDPDGYKVAVPGGKLPAIVHKGLSALEEIDLRIDHSKDLDRVELDEWSLFLAIKQLNSAGYDTQDRIAEKLGLVKLTGKNKGKPRREYVQTRVNLARLPVFVQDEIRKLTLNKDTTAVRWADIPGLYKVHSEEYLKYPDGDGPLFVKAWEECLTPEEVSDSGTELTPKDLTPADAVKRSQAAQSTALKQIFLAVTQQSTANLAEIDSAIIAGETAVHTLKCIFEYLGEKDYALLLRDSRQQHDAKVADAKVACEEASAESETVEA